MSGGERQAGGFSWIALEKKKLKKLANTYTRWRKKMGNSHKKQILKKKTKQIKNEKADDRDGECG